MADFCRDCTIELFGAEFADRNEMRDDNMSDDEMAYSLCEDCGWGWFDRTGKLVAPATGRTIWSLKGAKARIPRLDV